MRRVLWNIKKKKGTLTNIRASWASEMAQEEPTTPTQILKKGFESVKTN